MTAGAARLAAARVAEVADSPTARLDLLASSYLPLPGSPPLHRRYRRAATAFMGWQVDRGLLDPVDRERPGSPWWRAVNGRLLLDTCEARLLVLGHAGPPSSASVAVSADFARQPSVERWYRAHNTTIVTAYLEHRELAERENRVERFFLNLVLVRLLYAHALVAAPRLALARLAPAARWLGDPRRAMTGLFLSVSRVLPDTYPLSGDLDDYIAGEHTVGRLLDLGVVSPRLPALYEWSAAELGIPDLRELVSGSTPAYAWEASDREPWTPAPTRLVRIIRRALPPPTR
ncbi:hypothetical protein [Nocardioides sp. GXQ0305]|uniref:hypothetical protein n=1 Tax=Nocardioides sp. GXQ0305 TaxID=3423912 RepID=UPI003D7CEEE3